MEAVSLHPTTRATEAMVAKDANHHRGITPRLEAQLGHPQSPPGRRLRLRRHWHRQGRLRASQRIRAVGGRKRCSLCACFAAALSRTIADRLDGSLLVACPLRTRRGDGSLDRSAMAAVRAGLELQVNGAVSQVSVRQDGQVVRRANVASASAAQECAREQTHILRPPQRRTG